MLVIQAVLFILGVWVATRAVVDAVRLSGIIDELEREIVCEKDARWRARLALQWDHCQWVLKTRLAMIPIGLVIVGLSISPLPRLLGWMADDIVLLASLLW